MGVWKISHVIRTKSIYDPKETDDGKRVLVTRYYPRGVGRDHFDVWLRDLAPSAKLLKLYRDGEMTIPEYSAEYQLEISEENARQAIHELSMYAEAGNVTLLCYEPEGEFCHRHILKRVVQSV